MNGAVADCHRRIFHFFPGACYTTGDYMKEIASTVAIRSDIARWDLLGPVKNFKPRSMLSLRFFLLFTPLLFNLLLFSL